MKIVINQCFGGFGLSSYAMITYLKKKEIKFKIESDDHGDSSFYLDNSKKEKAEKRQMARFDPKLEPTK